MIRYEDKLEESNNEKNHRIITKGIVGLLDDPKNNATMVSIAISNAFKEAFKQSDFVNVPPEGYTAEENLSRIKKNILNSLQRSF